MKNVLMLAGLFLLPLCASAKRPPAGSTFMAVHFFKCAEASSGICAKDVNDGGGPMPYVSYRKDVTFQVNHCPEFTSKILQHMKQHSTDTLSATVAGFTITGAWSRPDELIITQM